MQPPGEPTPAHLEWYSLHRADAKEPGMEAHIALEDEQLALQQQAAALKCACELVAHQLRTTPLHLFTAKTPNPSQKANWTWNSKQYENSG